MNEKNEKNDHWSFKFKEKTKYCPYLPPNENFSFQNKTWQVVDFIAHGSHADVFAFKATGQSCEEFEKVLTRNNSFSVEENIYRGNQMNSEKRADREDDIDSHSGNESVCSHESLSSTVFEDESTRESSRPLNLPDELAVKVEPLAIRRPSLLYEARVMRRLTDTFTAMPKLVFYCEAEAVSLLAMERLGPSLQALMDQHPTRRLPLPTVAKLGIHLTRAFQGLHERHFVHRSVKPENFCVGLGPGRSNVFVIDFGRARLFRDSRTLTHIRFSDDTWRFGDITGVFCSIHNNIGIEKTRRDDMEALAHMLIYFLRGELPWAKYQDRSSSRMARAKQEHPIDKLCSFPSSDEESKVKAAPNTESDSSDQSGKDPSCKKKRKRGSSRSTSPGQNHRRPFPPQFAQYLRYCRKLLFDEEPDYDYLVGLLEVSTPERYYYWEQETANRESETANSSITNDALIHDDRKNSFEEVDGHCSAKKAIDFLNGNTKAFLPTLEDETPKPKRQCQRL